jgi:5'-3' exonuclease
MKIREWLYGIAEIVLRLMNEKENEKMISVFDFKYKQAS